MSKDNMPVPSSDSDQEVAKVFKTHVLSCFGREGPCDGCAAFIVEMVGINGHYEASI